MFFIHDTIQCASRVHSLSVVDHEIVLRLDALKHDYLLVLRRFCMMLHSTNFPYDFVGNDSAYFLSQVTLFCDVLTCALFPRVFFLNSVATLNMYDSWLRMLQDDEPPKSSRRPRKNKVLRPTKRAKFTKVTQARKKGPSRGKTGHTEPRGVEGMYQNSRCASREKT